MAGARRARGFCNRLGRVKQFKGGFELLGPTGLKVLEKLGAGSTATETARALGCTKSNITYWKNKLLDVGALRLQVADVCKFYQLTLYGSKILARSDKLGSEPVCLEDCAVKFPVIEHEKIRVDWKKLGSPRNWQQLGITIGNVKVEKTSRHVIIHPGRLKGFDVDELEVTAGRIIERTKAFLESRFSMVLSDEGVPLHKPIYRFYSQEAREDVKHGTCVVDGVGSVDESPPEKEPHEEYSGKNRARARLLLPDSVKRIETKIDSLIDSNQRLADSIGKLVDFFQELTGQPGPEPGKLGVPDYVR